MLKEVITEYQHYFIDENGLAQGEYLRYFSEGKLEIKCFYKDGKHEGEYLWFWSNGILAGKCFFRKGRLEGEHSQYSKTEQLTKKFFYKNGSRISEEEYKILLISHNLKRIKA